MRYDVVKKGTTLMLLKDGEVVDSFVLDNYYHLRKWTRDKAFSWFGSYNEGLCPIVHRHLKKLEFKNPEGEKVWRKAVKLISEHLRQRREEGVIRSVPKENRQLWKEIVKLSKEFESEWELPYRVGDLPKLRFRIRSLGIPFCQLTPYDPKEKLEAVLTVLKELKDAPGEKWERTELLFNRLVPEKVRAWIETGEFNKELYGCFLTERPLEEITDEGMVDLFFTKNLAGEDVFCAKFLNPEDTKKVIWKFYFNYSEWIKCPLRTTGKIHFFERSLLPEKREFYPDKGIELPGCFSLKFYKNFHVEALFENKALYYL